jgi:outer membrane lipoprotein-sorting protein
MKHILLSLTLASLLALTATAQTTLAPTDMTARQVLDKYVAAIGGKDALLKINDLTMEMSSETERGAMMMTRKAKLPNKSAMVINAMGMEVYKMVSDGKRVMMGGMQGNRTLDSTQSKGLIAGNVLFPELRYADMGGKATLDGIEKINGKDASKITIDFGSSSSVNYYDVATGLKVKTITQMRGPGGPAGGQGGSQTTDFADYKAKDGIQFPMTIVQQSPRGTQTITVDSIKINKGLKDSDFTVN